jgi:aspartyl-tRNA(Asn)/glutamyl-tRNA(Gln) amidotransferase subunit A
MRELDLAQLSITEAARLIRDRKLSPVELARFHLDRMARLNPALNAYITVLVESALAEAERAEAEIRRGVYRGPLHGIPIGIKDNIAVKGCRATAGSKILSDWVPDFDATVVSRLREAGAVILGKNNMHEWAKGSSGINPFFGTSPNPWDTKRVSGGSSGGSAVAVAAGMGMASIGTDSAGSVRNPASFCGVAGLKPTYGRVSVHGGVPGTGGITTNHFGILARTAADAALILERIAGHDPRDPLSSREPVAEYSKSLGAPVHGLRLGILRGYFDADVASEVKRSVAEAVRTLESLGMRGEELSIPHLDLAPAVQQCTSRAESTTDHDRYLRSRPRDYSPALLYQQICALTIPASAYIQAQRVRRLICQEFDEALSRLDAIVLPTVPVAAPTIEDSRRGFIEVDGRTVQLAEARGNFLMMCTIPFNVTGLPAVTICCGFSSEGMPIGLQLAGAPFREERVLQVAHAYERAVGFCERRPPVSGAGAS